MLLRNYLISTLCLLSWVGSGCAGSSPPTTIVCGTCEEPDRFVRLQTHPNPSSSGHDGGFSHPLKLSPENWKPLLASIRVRPVGNFLMKSEEEAAFTSEEVDYLGMTLSRAFAEASPEQWVIFGLSNPAPATGNEMTTGAWYVEETLLHLQLPNFHAPVRMDNLRQVLNRDPLFEVLEATRYEFLLPTKYTESDKGTGNKSLRSFLKEENPHLVMEYQLFLSEGSGSKEIQEEDGKGAQAEKFDENGISPSSIEERLVTLKRLKEMELITEEDYQRRKKELLDQL